MIGTRRTRKRGLYDPLLRGYSNRKKAEDYIDYLERESRFTFVNKLAGMGRSKMEQYLDDLLDDSFLVELESCLYKEN